MEVNAFESVRQRGVPLPITAPAATVVPQELVAARKWRIGPPPHAGWWLTRLGYSKAAWRWWDGERWSLPSSSSNSAVDAAAVAQFASNTSFAMAWCMDWPEGARVPRVNPATGAVTGGVQ